MTLTKLQINDISVEKLLQQLLKTYPSKTDLYPSLLGDKNRNAWLTRMNLNGTTVSGWPKEFGSTGDDVAYDLKEAERRLS